MVPEWFAPVVSLLIVGGMFAAVVFLVRGAITYATWPKCPICGRPLVKGTNSGELIGHHYSWLPCECLQVPFRPKSRPPE